MPTRLAYFGPPGTNSEEAALKYSSRNGGDFEMIPVPTINGVGMAIESGMMEQGVMPIENALDGAIAETLDFLVHAAKPIFIRDEIVMPIEHLLLARPGVRADQVRVITSIPTALAQCRSFIERLFPKATIEAALSTAGAVEDVMRRDDAAAIGNKRAAELYGAETLATDISDRKPNHTRFVVIALEDHEPTGDDKTSLAFTFAQEDEPGMLVAALNEFSARSINLSKIESRPSKEKLGTYVFLADLGGHRTDAALAEALVAVEKGCSFFKILGSYPRWRE